MLWVWGPGSWRKELMSHRPPWVGLEGEEMWRRGELGKGYRPQEGLGL